MKTICARTNPAFKRTQLLPVLLNLMPPTTGSTVRQFSAITPPPAVTDPKTSNVLIQLAANAAGRCQLR